MRFAIRANDEQSAVRIHFGRSLGRSLDSHVRSRSALMNRPMGIDIDRGYVHILRSLDCIVRVVRLTRSIA